MSIDSAPLVTVTFSPCIGTCRLDAAGYCVGCLRNRDEIKRWRDMPDQERLHYLRVVLPQRQAN